MSKMKLEKLLKLLVLGAALSGCSAARLAPDADGISFPVRDDSYQSEGIVASAETARLLRPGLSKDQLRQLLGNPHFSEGLVSVQDWNYILMLPAEGGGLLDCQLQLRFDGQRVSSLHWQTAACVQAAGAPGTAKAAAAEAGKAETWIEDGLVFPFGRSQLDDLAAVDRQRLEAFASRVSQRAGSVQRITVIGHADRIGAAPRKQWRSLDRAHAVAKVFTGKGIPPSLVEVIGRGDSEQLADCPARLSDTEEQACLRPDRRVLVTVHMVSG